MIFNLNRNGKIFETVTNFAETPIPQNPQEIGVERKCQNYSLVNRRGNMVTGKQSEGWKEHPDSVYYRDQRGSPGSTGGRDHSNSRLFQV